MFVADLHDLVRRHALGHATRQVLPFGSSYSIIARAAVGEYLSCARVPNIAACIRFIHPPSVGDRAILLEGMYFNRLWRRRRGSARFLRKRVGSCLQVFGSAAHGRDPGCR